MSDKTKGSGYSMKDTLANIPLRAKLMIASTLLLVVGAGYWFSTSVVGKLSGKTTEIAEVKKSSQIAALEPDTKLGAVKFGDKNTNENLGEISTVFKKGRREEIDKTKKTGESFMDVLEIKNVDRNIEKTRKELAKTDETHLDGMDEFVKEQEALKKQIRKEKANKLTKLNEKRGTMRTAQKKPEPVSLFDETGFLDKEIENSKYSGFADDLSALGRGNIRFNSYNEQDENSEKNNESSRDSLSRSGMNFDNFAKVRNQYDNDMAKNDPDFVNPLNIQDNEYNRNMNKKEQVSSGEVFYGVFQIEADSDRISPIRMTILEPGKLYGAVLLGEPKRVSDRLVLAFNQMSHNNVTQSINAIAIDLETYDSHLADDVDYHTFERYFNFAVSHIVAGAFGNMAATSVSGSGDTREESTSAITDSTDQLKAGLGALGEKWADRSVQGLDRPPTVKVYGQDREIGVLFMAPVK